MQCNLARRNRDDPRLQTSVPRNLLLAAQNMLKGNGDMGVQLLPLRRQRYPMPLPHKQGAAQLLLQLLYHPRHIGLVVEERSGGCGKAFIFGYIIKYSVIIVINVQSVTLYIKFIYLIYKNDILHISCNEL